MHIYLKKLTQFLGLSLLYLTVFLAVSLSLLRMATPYLENYLPEMDAMFEKITGLQIEVKHLNTGWHRLGPGMRLESVIIRDAQGQKTVATVEHLDIELDLFSSFREMKLVPGLIQFESPVLFLENLPQQNGDDKDVLWSLVSYFHEIHISDGLIQWARPDKPTLKFLINDFEFYPKGLGRHMTFTLKPLNQPGYAALILDSNSPHFDPAKSVLQGYVKIQDWVWDPSWMPSEWKEWTVKDADVDLSLWFKFKQGFFEDIRGNFALEDTSIQNESLHKDANLSLNSDVHFKAESPEKFSLQLDKAKFIFNKKHISTSQLYLKADPEKLWNLKLNTINLGDLLSLYGFAGQLPDTVLSFLKQAKPSAQFNKIQLLTRPERINEEFYLGTELHNLVLKESEKYPGVQGLSGILKVTPEKAMFEIGKEPIVFSMKNIFSNPLQIAALQGTIEYIKQPFLKIQSNDISIKQPDLDLNLNFALEMPAGKSPILQLDVASGSITEVELKKYFPDKMLSSALTNWILESIEKIKVSKMQAHILGPLDAFPYAYGGGVFQLKFDAKDLNLKYSANWPTLTQAGADFFIDGKELQTYVYAGALENIQLKQAVVNVDYRDSNKPIFLALDAEVAGDAGDAKTFIKHSPLWESFKSTLDTLDILGALDSRIRLNLPLNNKGSLNSVVDLNFQDNQIKIKNSAIDFSKVTGKLNFNNGCFGAQNITAIFNETPAQLNVVCQSSKEMIDNIWTLSSTFKMSQFADFIKTPWDMMIKGQSTYSANWVTSPNKPLESIKLQSNLKGISVALPQPLGKTADTEMPFSIVIPTNFAKTETVLFSYADIVQALVKLGSEQEKKTVTGVKVGFGKDILKLTDPVEGFTVDGNIATLHADSWLAWADTIKTKSTTNSIDIAGGFAVENLYYQDFYLKNVKIGWKKEPSAWLIFLSGSETDGTLRLPAVPSAETPFELNFNRYSWYESPEKKQKPSDSDPRKMPAINFYCKEFIYLGQALGEINIKLRPTAAGVIFDPVNVKSMMHEITAKGKWEMINNFPHTQFNGKASSADFPATLAAWGLKNDIRDSKGEVLFDLNWPGSPANFNKGTVAGNVDLSLDKGRIVDVNPGLGRLLGLFSVETIQRRLQLDFSDIFKDGFSFDSFKAPIQISKGYAYTSQAALKAPAASMDLSGKVGLVNQALDLRLDVKAKIDSTVPAAAVAIANPIAGAALLVFGQIFNPLDNLAQSHYHITGTWSNPVFTDVTKDYVATKPPVKEAGTGAQTP